MKTCDIIGSHLIYIHEIESQLRMSWMQFVTTYHLASFDASILFIEYYNHGNRIRRY